MRSGRRLAGCVGGLLASCVMAAGARGAGADPVGELVGHRFETMAYNRSRASELTPAAAAEEAVVLLLAAQRADAGNVHTAKLLVEAARAAGDKALQREALRTLVRLDPGDLVAQVQYIDYLASGAQTIDERARVFQAALDSAALDVQIRSEMAQRLANIARERGDGGRAAAYVDQALGFNNVNVGALQAMVAGASTAPEELKALIALVRANPLQPEAWVEMARLVERAGLFDAAAQFMNTALEQEQAAGQSAAADLYLELALDLATAGRPVEARPVFEAVAKLDDAPLSALAAAKLAAGEMVQKAGTASAPATQATEGLDERIGKKLEELVKNGGGGARVLEDAVWVEVSALATVGTETAGWMEALRKLVPADDAALVRLEGWRLLREGKLEEARGILEKAAPGDPLAQLGLVKVMVEEHRTADAQRELQDLWWTHPTGLFALQVAQAARSAGGAKLAPAVSTQELSKVLAGLPSMVVNAHRRMIDLALVTANLEKRNVQLEEAVPLHVRMTNTAGWPMAVGPEGFFKTTAGVSAKTEGVDRTNLGLYAIEDLQRVYRLDPRGTIEGTVRVDQGTVAEYLMGNPRQTATVDVSMMTAPRGGLKDAAPGLGGVNVPAGDFMRTGRALGSGTDIEGFLNDLPKATGFVQAVDVELLGIAVNLLSDEQTRKASRVDEAPEATEARTALRARVTKALVPMLESDSGMMRAWTVLNLPTAGLNELQEKVMRMSGDGEVVVRLAWVRAMGEMIKAGGEQGTAAEAAVRKQGEADADPQVRRNIAAMIEDLKETVAAIKAGGGAAGGGSGTP